MDANMQGKGTEHTGEAPAKIEAKAVDYECALLDQRRYEALADTIVNDARNFAWLIVDRWLKKHDECLIGNEYYDYLLKRAGIELPTE